MHRTGLRWKHLFIFFAACAVMSIVAWGVLLTMFCSHPRVADPGTQHVIAHNCHGMTVFISPIEEALMHWLIPLEMLFILLSLLAGAAAAFDAVRRRTDVRIDVRIYREEVSGGAAGDDGGRGISVEFPEDRHSSGQSDPRTGERP